MKRTILWLCTIMVIAGMLLTACATPAAPTTAPQTKTEEPAAAKETVPPAKKELKIVYVTPSTESGYWGSYVLIGIQNAVKDIEAKYGVKVTLDVQGPTAESMQDQFMSTLEAVISQKPDGIALGQLNPDAVAPLVKQATEKGIRVNLISIGVNLKSNEFGTLYDCDQPQQGELAANAYVDALKAKGLPLNGVTAVHMSVVVPILEEKIQKFKDTLKQLAPDMEILETQYNQNDVNNGISLMQNQLATYGDKLVGFFGGNNVTGDAIARVIEESKKADKLVGVAVDSDPAEIEAMSKGYLDALVVQTPYEQAYQATMDIATYVLEGKDSGVDRVNIPAGVVTPKNMNETDMKALLDPTILKK